MTVETLQHPHELREMVALFQRLQPRVTLEIGAWHGGTLRHWLRLGETVVVVDNEMRGEGQWREWAADAEADLVLIRGQSQDPQTILSAKMNGPYGWVFIDADHEYEAVRADWNNYGPMVDQGGVVVFHDIKDANRPDYGVHRLWAEIKNEPFRRTAEFSENAAYWGNIGVVWM